MHARGSRLVAFIVASTLSATAARAQAGAPLGPVSEEAKAEGKRRFDKALTLYEEGDTSGALAEFRRAFELTGSLVALYNIGLVLESTGQYVEADAALTAVLDATPDPLKPEWHARAMEARAHARARIGLVELHPTLKDPPPVGAEDPLKGAVVELDTIDVGRWPLAAPLRVNLGKHTVGLLVPGYAPARASVLVAGEATAKVALELVAMDGQAAHLAVRANVVQASIVIDGEAVGVTPITVSIALAPGKHLIELKRRGYSAASTIVSLRGGESGEARLDLSEDPVEVRKLGALVLVSPTESDALVIIDGTVRDAQRAVAIAPGPHHLHVERAGFLALDRDFDAEEGRTLPLRARLQPMPETLAAHGRSVASHRTWGYVGVGAGGAVLAANTVWLVSVLKRRGEIDDGVRAFNARYDRSCDLLDSLRAQCLAEKDNLDSDQSKNSLYRGLAVGGMVAGASLIGIGIYALATGPDPHRYDDALGTKSASDVKWSVTPVTAPSFVGMSLVGSF